MRRFLPAAMALGVLVLLVAAFVMSGAPAGPEPPRVEATPGGLGGMTPSTPTAMAIAPTPSPAVPPSLPVYQDSLGSWGDGSWGGVLDPVATAFVRSGSHSLSFEDNRGWGGLALTVQPALELSPYTNLRFYINGGEGGGQPLLVFLDFDGTEGTKVSLDQYLEGGRVAPREWREADIPLEALGVQGRPATALVIQDASGQPQPRYYLDDIEFYAGARLAAPRPPSATVQVKVDAKAEVHPISPLVYGVSSYTGSKEYFGEMGVSIVRWGGNDRTRHNWEINATNAGSDWFFANKPLSGGDTTPGRAADDFVLANRAMGAETLLTIPTMGWVARDGDNNTRSSGVPKEGGPPAAPGSEAIAGYDPTSNRRATSIPSYPRKGAPFAAQPDPNDGAVYQDEWVNHLVGRFGSAQNGGVRYYAMDNEPDLWADGTHRDIHPVRVGYDEALQRFLDYAQAVKDVDPSARVTGPVGWGWTSLWFSALDRGEDNFATAADRKAHGGVPFLQWFLRQLREHDSRTGRRTLDLLDIHFYPQAYGLYEGAVDPQTQALRLRSTRGLWSPSYADESWIAKSEGGPVPRLIPRLKQWIAAEYPGTGLALTEWNFGADNHINGALAIADVLGVLGREGVELATYWTAPEKGAPGYWAWRMYRNYDGSGGRFGDQSVQATTGHLDKVSAYAGLEVATGELKVMLVNKLPSSAVDLALGVAGYPAPSGARLYRYSAAFPSGIERLADMESPGAELRFSLPAYSITLVVLKPGGAGDVAGPGGQR